MRNSLRATLKSAKILGAAVAVFAPLLISATAQAADVDTQSAIGFSVTLPSNVELSHDKFFKFRVDPGTKGKTINTYINVSNSTDQTKEVRLAPADSGTQIRGGIGFTPFQPALGSGDPVPGQTSAVGSWITIQNSVVLAPNETQQVPFTLNIPPTALPGVNLGGISLWEQQVQNRPVAENDPNTAKINQAFVVRRVIGVEVVTPGVLDDTLRIDGVTPQIGASGIDLVMKINNIGTDYVPSGTGLLEVTQGNFQSTFDLGEVVPSTSLDYAWPWISQAPVGDYDASVRITYDNGKVATWTGKFALGDEIANRAKENVIKVGGKSNHMWLWIALGAAALLLIAAALFAFFWFRGGDDEDELVDEYYDDDEDRIDDEIENPMLEGVDPDVGREAPAGAPRFQESESSADIES